MAFQWADNIIYDELWLEDVAGTIAQGTPAVVQDVFGWYITEIDPNNTDLSNDVAFLYRCRQVYADKATGSGEAILAGDRLYYDVANLVVTPNRPAGVAGTNYYFCGWAKKAATAAASQVLMNFDGTRYDEAV